MNRWKRALRVSFPAFPLGRFADFLLSDPIPFAFLCLLSRLHVFVGQNKKAAGEFPGGFLLII
jgi:hypothetical protein